MYGKDGVKPDPAKTQKLKEKGRPTSQEEVRSFLQAAQFNAKFLWNTEVAYADTTQPLRELLCKEVPFTWGRREEESYNQIILALESAGALHPYNPDLDLCHVADAQPNGIGSSIYMITREKNGSEQMWPLNHASRSLTRTERGYPQIDRESLSQAWGMRQHRCLLPQATPSNVQWHKEGNTTGGKTYSQCPRPKVQHGLHHRRRDSC